MIAIANNMQFNVLNYLFTVLLPFDRTSGWSKGNRGFCTSCLQDSCYPCYNCQSVCKNITANIMGGIPLPSRGIVGKNQSTLSKTTVRSKREVSSRVRRGPHYLFPTVLTFFLSSLKDFNTYKYFKHNLTRRNLEKDE